MTAWCKLAELYKELNTEPKMQVPRRGSCQLTKWAYYAKYNDSVKWNRKYNIINLSASVWYKFIYYLIKIFFKFPMILNIKII